jgi:flagellar protein FliO/FliZ
MRRILLNLTALIAPLAAHAEAAQPFASPSAINTVAPSGVGSLGQVTLALGLVLAVIFGAAWTLRRMRGFGKSTGAALNVIADLPLGQKERAVLIRCGSTQLLLGVAPGRVNTLHVLTEPVAVEPERDAQATGTGTKPDFKAILRRSIGL